MSYIAESYPSTSAEIATLTALSALSNSGATQAIQKTGTSSFANVSFGSGTVTSVSGAAQSGVSVSVATATSTPVITVSLGDISPTSVNGLFITVSTGTLTISNGKTLTVSNTLTLAGTNGTTMTFPSTSATVARTDAGNTFTGVSTASAWVLTAPTITTSIVPTSDDGSALGSTSKEFSDLFLASGGVINWANGNVTLTHSTGVLTLAGTLAATSPKFTTDISDSSGNEVFKITATSSAVNEFTIANGATGNNASITASGETNTGITITGKGTKGISVGNALIEKVVTVTDAAGAVIDSSLGNIFTWTAGADRTAGTTTNAVAGQKMIIIFIASGGARTLTLPTSATGDFAYGSDITTISQTASGKADVIGCVYNTVVANKWAVVSFVKGF